MKKKIIIISVLIAWIAFVVIFQLNRENGEKTSEDTKSSEKVKKKAEPEPFLTNKLGMEFVYIPPGTFMMGSPPDEIGGYPDREKQHQVTLTSGFYMQTTEVTQGQWETVMKVNPSYFKDCGEDCPVEQVSWNDVQRFIWKLNQAEGANQYSLPTEAEWEYACRAASTTRFHWGNNAGCSDANYGVSFIHNECKGINPGKTMKVRSFLPNAWGLYDMHGNVWEWCLDRFDSYPDKAAIDPVGGYATVDRIYRGGSWSMRARYCRSANRDGVSPNERISELGFRLVRIISVYGIGNRRARTNMNPYP
ncbi:formylglycine-generating enzyme family protein [Desulfococcaceae bacterium HSG8]|nr:formylglycine-generating enzyme family protein [Desulfococcaceae bacterium HSG8]